MTPLARSAARVALAAAMAAAGSAAGSEGAPRLWLSSADKTFLLAEGSLAADDGEGDLVVVDESRRFQTVAGFGASMTESAAWSLAKLNPVERERAMKALFDPREGLGISLLRQPMGSPDFALSTRSYDDMPAGQADPELANFSIEGDRAWILPALKEAKALNPGLRLVASPWSPPAWMKSGGSMLGAAGGTLKPEYYRAYAAYFVKFLEAYRREGLPVMAVTPQNEPGYDPPRYAGMKWPVREQAAFVAVLGPALREAGLDVKILAYDHNWDGQAAARELLADPAAGPFLAGSAWHWYGGGPEAMSQVAAAFPGREIWFTEGGSGSWIGSGSFYATFKDGMTQSIRIMQHGSRSLVYWNLALDSRNGPIVFPNTANYGLLEVDDRKGVLVEPHRSLFYVLGQFSRFVRPDAVRIGCEAPGSGTLAVAFLNPDGSRAAVLYNRYMSKAKVRVRAGAFEAALELPGETAATLVW